MRRAIAGFCMMLAAWGAFGVAAPAAHADGLVAQIKATVLGVPALVRAAIDPNAPPCITIHLRVFGTPLTPDAPVFCAP